jgi:2-keto-4-pentenoate hydratase/2-oxohepta-3-ene-1,7-dioic acid hydratase in catechol pathway
MRLARYGDMGAEIPVVSVDETTTLDARPVTADFDPSFFANGSMEELAAAVRSDRLPRIDINGRRVGAPIARPGKVVCIGLNYRNHATESGMEIPEEPIIFMKAPNTIVGPNDDVMIPRKSVKTDWEVELAVIIGAAASYVESPERVAPHIAGYAISNDVSEREFQLERGGQWDKGKSCPTFNPLGPYLVTPDAIGDPQSLDMFLDVNDQRQQTGNTSDMIFSINHLVWYVSQFMLLEPGDVINTGTPAGVGLGFSPPRYLTPGDRMRLGIAGLGEQVSRVVATP